MQPSTGSTPAPTVQEERLSKSSPAVVAQALGLPSPRGCVSRRKFRIRLREPRGVRIRSARIAVANRRGTARRRRGRMIATVNLAGLPRGRFTLKVTVKTPSGKTIKALRRYRTCAAKRRG